MDDKLIKKLGRTKKGNRTKAALSKGELTALLAMLSKDRSIRGLENYAIVLTLVTTGFRASELCQLNWKGLDFFEGRYTVYFVGKGGLDAQQEIPAMAVEAAREAGIIKRELQFSPHLFRRTFASLLFKAGMDIKALQQATRHANVETLMRHYVDSSEATTPYWQKILGVPA